MEAPGCKLTEWIPRDFRGLHIERTCPSNEAIPSELLDEYDLFFVHTLLSRNYSIKNN
jgi:hypothetical protein